MKNTKLIRIGDFVFGEEEKKAINDLMNINSISEGIQCNEFEKKFSGLVGTDYCVSCNSGTSALMLVWQALKYHSKYQFKEGQKILTTPLSYIATANSIVTTGFEPVFVDINEHNFNLSEDLVKEHFENVNNINDYASILPVHLLGYPCDMNKINSIAKKHGLTVVEDSAEAHHSKFEEKFTGSLSLAGCFSFYIAHNIQVGEFGAITTSDEELALRARRLKGNGRMCYCTVNEIQTRKCTHLEYKFNPRYLHDMIGYNFKPMEFQAAIGNIQIKRINEINNKRRKNVKHLNDLLENNSDQLQLPEYSEDISYLGYPFIVIDKKVKRDSLSAFLLKHGIENRPIFNSIPTQQKAYAHLKKKYKGKLLRAEFVGNNGLYVGCHQFLSGDDLELIAKNIKSGLKELK